MFIQKKIIQILQEKLAPQFLEVINESDQHVGNATESHFKVIIVSDKFDNMKILQRHRLVNSCLAKLFTKFHALALHTYTNEQWLIKKNKDLSSPKCSGNRMK